MTRRYRCFVKLARAGALRREVCILDELLRDGRAALLESWLSSSQLNAARAMPQRSSAPCSKNRRSSIERIARASTGGMSAYESAAARPSSRRVPRERLRLERVRVKRVRHRPRSSLSARSDQTRRARLESLASSRSSPAPRAEFDACLVPWKRPLHTRLASLSTYPARRSASARRSP